MHALEDFHVQGIVVLFESFEYLQTKGKLNILCGIPILSGNLERLLARRRTVMCYPR